ncbi:hypothetical protein [Roseibium album]|uniref:hypothetical protein n=1 Tax=Roseibium album TaxID=311410 RepID=UPI0032971BEB
MPDIENSKDSIEYASIKLSAIKDKHISRFQKRANRYTTLSGFVIFSIIILLTLTAYVFFYAQDIDRNISTFDLLRQLDAAQRSQVEIVQTFALVLEGVNEESLVGARNTLDLLDAYDSAYRARARLKLIEEKIRLIREVGYPSNLDVERSKEEFSTIVEGLNEYKQALEEQVKVAQDRFDVGEGTRTDITQFQGKLGIVEGEIIVNGLRRDSSNTAQEIRQETGNIDVLNLVNTNLIRFGGVMITIFLISILVPIYRYNARLASFYLAKADALVLCRDTRAGDFRGIAEVVTPMHAFEKEPRTPIDSLAVATGGLTRVVKPR